MKQPNPKLHFYISMIKSTIRIYAGYQLIVGNGIIEEMV